jgi:UDP-N-acetylmuramate dehydrogenase
MEFAQNVPLGPLTTLGVGGPSRWYGEIRSESELQQALSWADECRIKTLILGGGSNVVISDRGWDGLTLRIAIPGIDRHTENGQELFWVGAGENWDTFVAETVKADCAGVECLSGIPGTVGGTPVQNVGAYGQDVSETIVTVRAYRRETGEFEEFTNEECGFHYRTSRFNTTDRDQYIITSVTFALKSGVAPKIEYADLRKYFAARSESPTLQETRDAVREIRRSKAMLIAHDDEDSRSAGSFFRNPVVDMVTYQRIAKQVESKGLVPPSYPAGESKVKIPAAWLVEQSGIHKGFTLGRVGISRKHALAIINRGQATAAEVIALKERVQQQVRDVFGVELHPEPILIGFPTSSSANSGF